MKPKEADRRRREAREAFLGLVSPYHALGVPELPRSSEKALRAALAPKSQRELPRAVERAGHYAGRTGHNVLRALRGRK